MILAIYPTMECQMIQLLPISVCDLILHRSVLNIKFFFWHDTDLAGCVF